MNSVDELFGIAKKLEALFLSTKDQDISAPLLALEKAAEELNRSFSGSWLGYHACVYYENLDPAPAGANFSQEWGLKDLSYSSLGSRGNWEEFLFDEVQDHIRSRAGDPDISKARQVASDINEVFGQLKADILSIFEMELGVQPDNFLTKLKDDIENCRPFSKQGVLNRISPSGQIMTRDMIAMGQGTKPPPHLDISAEVTSIKSSFGACKTAADIAKKAASHLDRRLRTKEKVGRIGTNVFIGHGRSHLWRELKDFVSDRLQLPYDEFNRVPVAGVTNIARLSEMLDAAAVALLIMTAEDEMADGEKQARMNVIHEAGLFQGRLGFTKAIVILEDGCAEFSNIAGLGQIRFPKGKIASAFEEIRQVMEREGLVE